MPTNRIKGITLEISGDVTKLDKALKGVNTQIKSTQSSLRDVERLLKLDPTNTQLLAQKQQLLTKAIEDTRQKLDTLKEAEQQAQEQFQQGKISQEQYQGLQREIAATEQQLQSLQTRASECNTALVKISAAGEAMQKMGGAIEGAGKKLLPLTGAVAALGAAAVKTTADFDAAMAQVAAVSGATGDDFDALREKAREMGAKTKFSASEAAEAMNYMAMAGWKTGDMLSGIEGIMNLAAASGEELASTSDIVTDALTAFGMTAADSGHFADILAAASSNANTNVSMLGESFKYVAPVAGALGYSAEDTSIALGLMANSGIKASQAGTALRTLLTNMAKPTDDMALAMESLGISLEDSEGNMYSLMEIMQQLRKGFEGGAYSTEEFTQKALELENSYNEGKLNAKAYSAELNSLMTQMYGAEGAAKAELAAMLAGKTGMSGFLAIVNASEQDFNKLSDAIYNCSGTTKSMADTMQNNLSGQITILMSQLQELAISFGDMLMPTIRSVVTGVQSLVDKLNSMDESTRTAIVTVAAIVAALGPLLIVIGKIITSVGTIMTLVPKIAALFEAISGGIAIFTGAAATGSAGATAFAGALAAITGPVGIVIAAVAAAAAAIVLLWNHCEGFRDAVTTAWGAIQQAFQAVSDWLQATFASVWETVVMTAQTLLQTFQGAVVAVWEAVQQVFQIFSDFLLEVFGVTWQDVFAALQENATLFGTSIQTMVLFITTVFQELISFLSDVFLTSFQSVLQNAVDFFTAVKDNLVQISDGIKTIFQGIIDFIGGVFSGDWERVWQGVQDIFHGIFTALEGIAKAPINGIIGMINTAINAVNVFIRGINKAIAILAAFGANIPQIPELAPIAYLAKGGILEAGSAIVGERGPELLSMIGGKARVTPLTGGNDTRDSGVTSGAAAYNQTLNFYSAAMTPAEVARQTRNATRKMLAGAKA